MVCVPTTIFYLPGTLKHRLILEMTARTSHIVSDQLKRHRVRWGRVELWGSELVDWGRKRGNASVQVRRVQISLSFHLAHWQIRSLDVD